MTAICPSSILACGMRVTLLDDLGNVNPDANNFWVTDDLIQITTTPELATGSDREQRSGCDCVIASAKFPDLLKRWTFEIQKGQLQPGLEALMLGEDVILDGEDPIGALVREQLAVRAAGDPERRARGAGRMPRRATASRRRSRSSIGSGR